MKLNKLLFAMGSLFLCSCSHSLKFVNNHFAVPITAENTWGGHVSATAAGVTSVTVVNDITSEPPRRDEVLINTDISADNAVVFWTLGLNGSLGLFPSVEVFYNMGTWGLRWQFLNHGLTPDQWVAATQVGYSSNEQSTTVSGNSGSDSAKSEIKSKQAAISVGYRFAEVVPYMSYVYNAHDVTTNVRNAGGAFGPYEDKGVHQSLSWGVTSYKRGLDFGAEATLTKIDWDRSSESGKFTIGGKMGYAW